MSKYLFQILCTVAMSCCGLVLNLAAEWERVPVGSLASLHAVYFLDSERGWIAGSNGSLLTSIDGGRSWKVEKPFTKDDLLDVHFIDVQNGWLLCERDRFSSGKNSVSYLRRTTDGGKTWESIELDGSGRDRLVRMAFSKDGFGYVFGEGGAVWQMLDDRSSWKRSPLPVRYLIRGGWFVDSFNGVLVGGSGTTLFTIDGGAEWSLGTGDKAVELKLNDVFFVDPKRGWAVGGSGTILSTVNGGRIWHVQESVAGEDLLSICFTRSGTGIAVGEQGRILETSTSGPIWRRVESGVRSRLEDVAAAGDVAVAVGFGGAILRRN